MNKATELYTNSISLIKEKSPVIAKAIEKELYDQRHNLKLIASENYCSPTVMASESLFLNDKYSEGFCTEESDGTITDHRYYAGCDNINTIEAEASKLAREVFGCEYAYMQPHSGSNANLIAYWAVLSAKIITPELKKIQDTLEKMKDTRKVKSIKDLTKDEWENIRKRCHSQKILTLSLDNGGHLTHGDRTNISSQIFDVIHYGLNEEGFIDYDELERIALNERPLIILAGYSAYTGKIDFKRFRDIADKCGAVLMSDISHFAGLVAGKVYTGIYDPIPYSDIVTTTTHKTLRGPRSAMVLSKKWLQPYLEKGCPMVQGGCLPNMLASKAIALEEAKTEEFQEYAHQIVKNAKELARALSLNGIKVHTNGTENHMVLIDVTPLGLNGRQAEYALRQCGITTNRNTLPNDKNGAWYTSGIRLGVSALTTLGMKEGEMDIIASWIALILANTSPVITKSGKPSLSKVSVREDIKEDISRCIEVILEEYIPYKDINV